MGREIPKQKLLAALQEVAEELGRTPSQREVTRLSPYHGETYNSHFESFHNALRSAGLDPKFHPEKIPTEQLLSHLSELRQTHDTIDADTVKNAGKYHPLAYVSRFDSLDNALETLEQRQETPELGRD